MLTHSLLGTELVRSLIEHKKVFILALNGPAVGAAAAWFSGLADIVYAAESSSLHASFSSLGIVPENGCLRSISQTIGIHRANDMLMFGRKTTAQELEQWGLVNKIFLTGGFHKSVADALEEQLKANDGKSMMLAKQMQNAPLRAERLLGLYEAADALAERFVDGAPFERFLKRAAELAGKFPSCIDYFLMISLLTKHVQKGGRRICEPAYGVLCMFLHASRFFSNQY